MKLYENFCYEDLDSVRVSISSKLELSGNLIDSVLVLDNSILINFQRGRSYTFTPPDCFQLGFNQSYTPLTSASDAIELGFMVVGVLISAYVFRILKRSF